MGMGNEVMNRASGVSASSNMRRAARDQNASRTSGATILLLGHDGA